MGLKGKNKEKANSEKLTLYTNISYVLYILRVLNFLSR